ncbi:hypothetical protein RND71_012776 [Anisodus tanguticus]|uniref:Pentatricopeptide repeat-containing protein n=1 Tax=Anisodus tanguticus TaxID=243964 RepID=A0AAE1SDY6_9SOLA|nr:hypothetical protein RND71_012776 [Anisodus tanguticus]
MQRLVYRTESIKSKSIAHYCLNFTRSFSSSSLSNLLKCRISHTHLQQIHARVFLIGAHQDNLIATRLIGQYPSNYSLRILPHLKTPNLYPFNAIIRVLSEEGNFTHSFLVHTLVVKLGFGDDPFVCNGLLSVYARGLKELSYARKVFDEMPEKDIVCWTCLISGYAKLGLSEDALSLFLSIVKKSSLIPENDTMVSVLSPCSKLDMSNIEKWIGNFRYDLGCSGCDSVSTVLVYLYGKLGNVDKSREIFEQISSDGKRSVLSWNAMIGTYVQNGCALDGLCLFRLMMELNCCCPDHVTMVSVLSACTQVGVWTLVYGFMNMYSKCGSLESARDVFDQLIVKDVVSFNAMIMGLAINGKGKEALELFSQMLELNLHPNAGTFLSLLCACSHSGLTEKGRQIFKEMSQCFRISPKLEHYASYIDLLARIGIGANYFLDNNSAGYVMLSNTYAIDHHWSAISRLRLSMKEKVVVKQPGCSWINIDGVVHEFLAGSSSHPQTESLHSVLQASFLSLDLRALSEQLERASLSERAFIEPDIHVVYRSYACSVDHQCTSFLTENKKTDRDQILQLKLKSAVPFACSPPFANVDGKVFPRQIGLLDQRRMDVTFRNAVVIEVVEVGL